MNKGYTPQSVPMPLLVAVGISFLLLFMFLLLSVTPYVPYYEAPTATQAPVKTNWRWWEENMHKEQEFRQDAYDAFQRLDFDTDRQLEKIEQDKEFFKMQRSVY